MRGQGTSKTSFSGKSLLKKLYKIPQRLSQSKLAKIVQTGSRRVRKINSMGLEKADKNFENCFKVSLPRAH